MGRLTKFDRMTAIDETMKFFWVKGYQNTSVRDLSEFVGVNAQSLYNAFGNKEKLYQLSLQHYVDEVGNFTQELIDRHLTTPELLKTLLIMDWETRDYPKGCMVINTLSEFETLPDDIHATVESLFNFFKTTFAQLIQNMPLTIPQETAIDLLLNTHNGIQVAVRDSNYPGDLDQLATDTVGLILGGEDHEITF